MSHEGNDWIDEKEHEEKGERKSIWETYFYIEEDIEEEDMSHEGNDWIFEKQHEEEIERMANKFQVIVDAINEMKEDKYYSDLHDKVAALGKGKGKQVYNDELNSLIDFVRKVEKEY